MYTVLTLKDSAFHISTMRYYYRHFMLIGVNSRLRTRHASHFNPSVIACPRARHIQCLLVHSLNLYIGTSSSPSFLKHEHSSLVQVSISTHSFVLTSATLRPFTSTLLPPKCSPLRSNTATLKKFISTVYQHPLSQHTPRSLLAYPPPHPPTCYYPAFTCPCFTA